MLVQGHFQILGFAVRLAAQIQMQYRVGIPVLFQIPDSQSTERLLFALEIGLQSRNQEALAETAGTAQEIILARRDQAVDQVRFAT